jgi:hypothetical protein
MEAHAGFSRLYIEEVRMVPPPSEDATLKLRMKGAPNPFTAYKYSGRNGECALLPAHFFMAPLS